MSTIVSGDVGGLLPEDMLTRILIAEDNPADVYLLREALDLSGHQVELILVTDGEQAIDYVQHKRNFAKAILPDLVVLDLNLPKSDGSDVLRCIREQPEYTGIPVVVLTSSDSPRDRKTIEGLGANCYITKPSDLDAFLALGNVLMTYVGDANDAPPLNSSSSPAHAN